MEILSWVPVMVMMRLRCVSKSWNSLIFNPTFIKLHLERSSRNTDILLTFRAFHDKETGDICLVYWRALHPPFTMLFGTDSINSRIYESWMSAMAWFACVILALDIHISFLFGTRPQGSSPKLLLGYLALPKSFITCLGLVTMIWEVKSHCLGDTCWRKSVYISESGDVTMLDNCGGVEVVLYNTRDNKILNRLVIEELLGSRYYSYDYCQSLVLPFGN